MKISAMRRELFMFISPKFIHHMGAKHSFYPVRYSENSKINAWSEETFNRVIDRWVHPLRTLSPSEPKTGLSLAFAGRYQFSPHPSSSNSTYLKSTTYVKCSYSGSHHCMKNSGVEHNSCVSMCSFALKLKMA